MWRVVRAAGLALCLWVGAARADDPAWLTQGRGGMVASDSPEASQIGAEVLQSGGNAFDAAVATSLALAVARPQSTGLGGGGFMVAYVAGEKRFVALDFREAAPAGATVERYAELHKARRDGPSASIYGGNAVAVPGLVAGLAETHKRFGTKAWGELVAPAVTLARVGFAADASYRKACREVLEDFERWPILRWQHVRLYSTLLGRGKPPQVGQRVRRRELAAALEVLAREGPEAFYRGEIGAAVVRAVRKAGGEMTTTDLRGYRVAEREPLRARIGDYEIVTMPPPSSGGVCAVEALNVLYCLARGVNRDVRGLRADGRFEAELVRSFKHAFADRARWLGDPDFAQVPTARLTNREYACKLAAKTADESEAFGSVSVPEGGGTSHFCVADRFGNVVAWTETINGSFGSLVVVEPYGIILNNEMDDFLTVRGEANLYGLRQGEANLVGPGKRPLSSMSPTIVVKDGRPVLALGASGGPRIITAVTQVILNVMEFEQSLGEAITAVRLHHQWQPDEVYFDGAPPDGMVAALKAAGEKVSERRKGAAVQAIRFLEDGTMTGASDPRKGGRPVGVP